MREFNETIIEVEQDGTPSGQPLGISHAPSRCGELFARYKERNMPAFIGYLPFGFPDTELSLEAFRTMVDNGVDIVEIGLPYSDPVMDGPVIQAASQIALRNGERIADVFRAVETVANAGGIPLIMSYWNLIFHYGVERFARVRLRGITHGCDRRARHDQRVAGASCGACPCGRCAERVRRHRRFHPATGCDRRPICRWRHRGIGPRAHAAR